MALTTQSSKPLQQDTHLGYQQFLRNLHQRTRNDEGAGQREPATGTHKGGKRRATPG